MSDWTSLQTGLPAAIAQRMAEDIVFEPTGSIAATDVQAAIAELNAEKAPLAHTHTSAPTGGQLTTAALSDYSVSSFAYSASNFFAASGLWTVIAANLESLHYAKLGGLLFYFFDIKNTNVTGPGDLRLRLPLSLTIAASTHGKILYQDASGIWADGQYEALAAQDHLRFHKSGYASNWTVTAGSNTRVRGLAIVRV